MEAERSSKKLETILSKQHEMTPERFIFMTTAVITPNLTLNITVDQVKGKSAMRGEWPAFPDLNAT
jgi:hypothetical protein